MMMMKTVIAAAIVSCVAMLAMVPRAEAGSIDLLDTSYTVSTQGAVAVNTFNLSEAGTLTLTLTDLKWPSALQDASFLLTTASGTVLGRGTGFGSESFQIGAAGTIYAVTFGQAAPIRGLTIGYGSYGVSANFQPVPLPAPMALLPAGLMWLWFAARRRPLRPVALRTPLAGDDGLPSFCKTNALA